MSKFIFDIIMGIDWLSQYRAIIECNRRKVTLLPSTDLSQKVTYVSERAMPTLLCERTDDSLVCMIASLSIGDKEMSSPVLPAVVNEFPDVFAKYLIKRPPPREVEFGIKLMPGAEPISIAPYRMAPAELKELQIQLDNLMSKGFIRRSVSPWSAPALFVQKKMEHCGCALTTGDQIV